jgi:nitric oxide reductase NorD protein
MDISEFSSSKYKEFTYEEFDFSENRTYDHHCRVRETRELGSNSFISDYERKKVSLSTARVEKLKKALEVLRPQGRIKIRRRPFGELDVDQGVRYLIDVQSGLDPDQRIYYLQEARERDVAVLFAIDVSGSTGSYPTRRCLELEKRTIDAEKEGLIHLLTASQELGDSFGVYAYSGSSRKKVDVWEIKDINEVVEQSELAERIMCLTPQQYNRTGAVYRHLLREKLYKLPQKTKIFIDINDGLPDDKDSHYEGIPLYKLEYGIADTKKVLEEARRKGVIAHCFSFIRKEYSAQLGQLWGKDSTRILSPADFEDKFVHWFIRTTLV